MNVLSVQNLGKAFRRYSSEWKRFASWFGFPAAPSDEHWVLQNVSFDIEPGEAIGIIGQNGAGKSTLLKMITGTMQPTIGTVEVTGRISAILELGMGFNPELTGRQNAYHGLGLMGYSNAEIDQIMPSIEVFADIGIYFDQSVRTYSSGMNMRVAFAIATATRPEILIIDEALSVGDAAFQRKCFGRIEKYTNDGMALLLVSHDIESIKKICTRVLFLNKGTQEGYGEAKKLCDKYEQYLFGSKKILQDKKNNVIEGMPESLFDPELLVENELCYGDGKAIIEDVWFETDSGHRANIFNMGEKFYLKYRVFFKDPIRQPVFSFLIKTLEGISLYGTDTISLGVETEVYQSGETAEVCFSLENPLATGSYFINCGVRDESSQKAAFVSRRVDAAMFKVRQQVDLNQVGLINMSARVSVVGYLN